MLGFLGPGLLTSALIGGGGYLLREHGQKTGSPLLDRVGNAAFKSQTFKYGGALAGAAAGAAIGGLAGPGFIPGSLIGLGLGSKFGGIFGAISGALHLGQ